MKEFKIIYSQGNGYTSFELVKAETLKEAVDWFIEDCKYDNPNMPNLIIAVAEVL